MIEIVWHASNLASALYTASVVARGRPPAIDARLADALAPSAGALATAITTADVDPDDFWRHAIPLAALAGSDRDLASDAFFQVCGYRPTEELVSELAARIAAVRDTLERQTTDATRELELRSGPLRELWEARGPGLLAAIGRATERTLLVERAVALPVQPICGGGGDAYPAHGSIAIEAVLANPHAELPEVVRLGWLISRLRCGATECRDTVSKSRLPWLASVAMIPPTLAAAEYVELARFDRPTLIAALRAWHVAQAPQADELADTLDRWWRTYSEDRVPWSVALAALEQLLKAGSL